MIIDKKKIAIIGGGPGGLTLARLLQLKGADVKVYERDHSREARVQGAIVDLHFGSGLKAIEEAGLLEEFKSRYMEGADSSFLLDKNAVIHFDERNKTSDAPGFGDQHFRPEIDRGALRDILLDALQPDTVIWDSQFVDMEPLAQGWTLNFRNGTTATGDLVIGSDGARSKIRPYVTDIRPAYAGVTIIQGEIDDPEKECNALYTLMGKATLSAFGDGKSITIQPRGDGGITFYVSTKLPENWVTASGIDFTDPKQVYAFLTRFFEGWDPLFFTLFNACKKFTPRQLTCIPLDQTWPAKSNITLIGDAAHIMPPSGEGVNLAMLDALELSEGLTSDNAKDILAAIGAYEEKMRSRAAKEAEDALTMHDMLHGEDALERMVHFHSTLIA